MSRVKAFLLKNKSAFFALAAAVLYLYSRWYLFIMEKVSMDDKKEIWLFASFVACALAVRLPENRGLAAVVAGMLSLPVSIRFPEFAFSYFPVVWLALLGSATLRPKKMKKQKKEKQRRTLLFLGFLPVFACFVFGIVYCARLASQGGRNAEEKENLFFIQFALLLLLAAFYAAMAMKALLQKRQPKKTAAGLAPVPPPALLGLCRGAAFLLLAVVLVYGFFFRRATFFEMQQEKIKWQKRNQTWSFARNVACALELAPCMQ